MPVLGLSKKLGYATALLIWNSPCGGCLSLVFVLRCQV